jgi:ribosomal protein L40E
MSIFHKMREGVDVAKWKADQLIRIQKVQGEIGELRNKISVIHSQIVTTTLDLHQRDILTQSELEELCLIIDAIKTEIADKEAKLEGIKREEPPMMASSLTENTAHIVCPQCYAKIPAEATFCTDCGAAIFKPERA